jgi:serine protease AprX
MKRNPSLWFSIAALFLSGCRQSIQSPTEWTDFPPPPTEGTEITGIIGPYQDVRNSDLSHITGGLDRSLIMTLWFHESTIWPENADATARDILERGKNPGLGIRSLHEQGITGKGVTVAIIDQNLAGALDHPEYQGKIVTYFDVGTGQPSYRGSMHGPAVASLLLGETIGAAPDAQLFFVAAPSWTGDAKYFADALDWIVDENNKLPEGEKIRVVSVSAQPSGAGSAFTKNNDDWDAAVARATAAGILVLDATEHRRVTDACYYDLDEPDTIEKCIPGWPGEEAPAGPTAGRILVPASRRTTAEEYFEGETAYQYSGRGGLSWSVPYLAGVLALGWQIRPDLTGDEMLQIVFDTAYVTEDGFQIINPGAFIKSVKSAGTT